MKRSPLEDWRHQRRALEEDHARRAEAKYGVTRFLAGVVIKYREGQVKRAESALGHSALASSPEMTLLERYTADPPQLPSHVQREIAAGTRDDPMWHLGPTGVSVPDILDATQGEIEALQRHLGYEE